MAHYIKIRGKVFGPFDEAQLQDMVKNGKLGRTTEISEDRVNWTFAAFSVYLFFNPENNVGHMAPVYGPPPHFESADSKIGFLKRLFNKIFGKK
jgi:hypothetical protein